MASANDIWAGVTAVQQPLHDAIEAKLKWPFKRDAVRWLDSANGQGFVFEMVRIVLEAVDKHRADTKEDSDGRV